MGHLSSTDLLIVCLAVAAVIVWLLAERWRGAAPLKGDALDAAIARRWLRNALEHKEQSPHTIVVMGAAIALVCVGRVGLRRYAHGHAGAERLRARGFEGSDPLVQAAQQWDLLLGELALLERDTSLHPEYLFGVGHTRYWDEAQLHVAALGALGGAQTAVLRAVEARNAGARIDRPPETTPRTTNAIADGSSDR